MNKDRSLRTLRRAAPAAVLGFALTACGTAATDSLPDPGSSASAEDVVRVEPVYFTSSDGRNMRSITYENDDSFADVLQWCDGLDLVEQTSIHYSSGNSIERSAGHAACLDGKLLPGDFELAPR